MTTRLEKVTEEYKDKFPHMKQYAACQSRAFMTGCFTFVAGGATVYLAQVLLGNRLPRSLRQYSVVLPIAVGSVCAYAITLHNTRICQNMWLAMEEKHSEVTPLQERLQQKQNADALTAKAETSSTSPSSS